MKTLYHYCSLSAFISMIESRSIRLSSLTLSNDSMEGKILADTLNKLFAQEDLDQKTLKQLKGAIDFHAEMFDGLGFCLSEVGDLLSQWRGYASDGEGFSVGFSKEYIEKLRSKLPKKEPKYNLMQVIYDPLEQQKAVSPTYEAIKSVVESGKLHYPTGQFGLLGLRTEEQRQKEIDEYSLAFKTVIKSLVKSLPNLFSLKSAAFMEEKEWRLISYFLKGEENNCSFFPRKNRIVPYREFELLPLDSQPILEVIIGPKNITPDYVVESLLKQNGFKDVLIKRSIATYR